MREERIVYPMKKPGLESALFIFAVFYFTFLLLGGALFAQTSQPFKLGTFAHGGRPFVGAVLNDSTVIDLVAANRSLELRERWVELPMAAEMKDLIGRYEQGGLRERVHRIVAEVGRAPGEHSAYVHDLGALETLPPIMYPTTMLNAAVNYSEHAQEMAPLNPEAMASAVDAPGSIPGIWERMPGDPRQNPYFFLKPSASVIAHGEAIVMPPERDQLDWESELAVVMGKPASHVPVEEAQDYIFGYTIENDVSDRAGRGDGRHGSDWLIGKSHDTYAPMGPFIVPKEFIEDPMKLGIKFTLSGKVMQDSSTANMIHNIYELVHYASNILTLRPGDVLATGSPAGVGAARNPPVFMKRGDTAECWIEGIGTLTNPVK